MTASAPTNPVRAAVPRVLVLGDLVLDVVLMPSAPIESGTDIPGRVEIRQGGSAANVARWLGRLGVKSQLVCAVGRDGAGRSLVEQVRRDGVTVRAVRIAGHRTGRIGVLVAPDGERSFVADRRAATRMRAEDLKPEWFEQLSLIHLPAYSLLVEPLGSAGLRAVELARSRSRGVRVSVDLASVGPLLAHGRREARELVSRIQPDVVLATEPEAEALLGRHAPEGLLEFARVAVIKRGARGARVFARDDAAAAGEPPLQFDIATSAVPAEDTTGAGDAFDAGFIAGWLSALAGGHGGTDALHRATMAGHRAAARHLRSPRSELPPG